MIRVGIVGVGNVASSLVQGVEYVKQGGRVPGILDLEYRPEEIDIVTAFDIDARKVGKKLSQAIFEKPNVVEKYVDVRSDVVVLRGPTLDGTEGILGKVIEESKERPVDVKSVLRENKVDVVVNLLPTGVERASEYYAVNSLEAGSSLVNASPAPLVERFEEKFKSAGLPLLGDDLISQIGGTALHAGIINFLTERGVKVTRSYQIDISGTTETLVTLEDSRKELKKRIKSSYISSQQDGVEVVAGTSDYVEFLGDRRVSYMVIEGEYALGAKVRIDVSMKSLDGPNAVAPLLDLIRLAKLLKDRGIGGSPPQICSHYFKGYHGKVGGDTRASLINFIQALK
ncbi:MULTISPECIES: inositol-3-phosphate synthase [Metallosphaera]|uniref:L-myo-inositol-1-phosphate synthase n=3 Tax=Metallosphaera TaxID=41980 RepID=A4YHZ2_METS5|nr:MULTISPECIES: L-myo-inositol-1-phosphate synthase [Metallosphaera]ABP96044.1 L-myo-inositol-1-phosphate synthase [Metallosphaera sedula DSM 5348]AIM28028.1 L-myo-inositol-1-phosphate synthase [Metallosphaera sedula]AKV74861.1 L-myo-inositol-1-phosphate synthase [Metallosphaera sedula]AKV77098.1 L-myo-inositol-1-phosphate synthase [Metallosphaera sedula]AKV79349.1 L-myo-inositol-1-phosphate synthase [Metallosphaera sedula]